MEFRLLGPVRLEAGGEQVDLGPPKQRLVLAALLVDAGRPVRTDTLVDRVWEPAPAEARNALYAHIMRIRRALANAARAGGEPVSLVRRAGGYLLEADPSLVDWHRFRQLTGAARDPAVDDRRRAELLREALELWHGTPLADLSGPWVERLRASWQRHHLDAVVAWSDAELRLGHHQPVLDRVRDLVADHPLDEPLVAVLMRALHAAGRDADALAQYEAIRHRLADALGTDPGAELRELHRALLRGEPVAAAPPTEPAPAHPAVPPAQLPPDVAGFAGREAELAALDALLAGRDQPDLPVTAVAIATISGTAGVGKTSLAVHWAHRVRDRFPDGQLYVDLRGFSADGEDATDPQLVVRSFLAALGVPSDRVPPEVDAQVGLYRSLLADRRMLILLDNARDADQVRPLLPGAPGCLVLVTSRRQLSGLVAGHGARPIALDLLSRAESGQLLARRLGPQRLATDPAAVDRIIAQCARLPLALAIVAARATAYPQYPLATLADQLAAPAAGIDTFASDDPATDIRSVFSWSYRQLSDPAARLFRLLGLHTGPDLEVPAVAALAGLDESPTRRLLAELGNAGLVAEPAAGRYTFHDLLRGYARELATETDPAAERAAAVRRLQDWFLLSARAATGLLIPEMVRLPVPAKADPAVTGMAWDDPAAATRWLEREHDNLLALIANPPAGGSPAVSWLLADALRYWFLSRNDRAAWTRSAEAGQAAARAANNPAAQAAMAHVLGSGAYIWADYQGAVAHYQRGLPLARAAGDHLRAAALHASLGDVRVQLGEVDTALDDFEQAYQLRRISGAPIPATLVASLAGACLEAGRLREVVEHCREAWSLARGPHVKAIILEEVADAYRYLGELTRARRYGQRAVELARGLDAPGLEAEALHTLSRTLADAGDLAGAAELAERMVAVARDAEDQRLEGYARLALIGAGRTDPGWAVAAAADAVMAARRLPSRTLEVAALIVLARCRLALAEHAPALAAARSAVELAESAGYRLAEGAARTTVAEIEQQAGEYAAAARTATAALATHRATGYRLGEARSLLVLGEAVAAAGDPAAAEPSWYAALDLFTAAGAPEAERVRALLRGRTAPHSRTS
ncbi:MAG TPA: BTAD domain-containing putative transcriptional regulator [Natronosporangium sp.]